ncbi:YajG family lipoprotein [Aliidiomarina celeris]|uniref:YajG family lipoprotein n=1 Tax=Aliidiomarina celeris TaxID=2249428 RepID=UPI00130072AA|nr:YajG family lipoprotein [Aliidiomarina celeris]
MSRHLQILCIAACAGIGLSGCQGTPYANPALNLNVSMEQTAPAFPLRLAAQSLQVIDRRPQHHVVRIHRGNKPAEFATSSQPLATLISTPLHAYYRTESAQTDTDTGQLTIAIEQTLCIVQQSLTRHHAECTIRLEAQAESDQGRLAKTYTYARQREGSLNVSLQHLSDDLSTLLSQALRDIQADNALHEWLQPLSSNPNNEFSQ